MKKLQSVKKQLLLTSAKRRAVSYSVGGTVTLFLSVLTQSFEVALSVSFRLGLRVALSELGVCEVVYV